MTADEATTPIEGPIAGVDHRHIFAAAAYGLLSEDLDGRMVQALTAAEEEDRRRGFIRVDTNSPQLVNALGIAFYEGYHGKPLPDKEWAGPLALHHSYGRAGHEAVSLLRRMTPGAELEAVGAALEEDPETDERGPADEPAITEETLAEVLEHLTSGLATLEPETPRTQFTEWGIYDPSEPFEGTQCLDDEDQARSAAAENPESVLCRRVNHLHGCIMTAGQWEQVHL